jgi:hypothetical protein
MIKTFGSPVTDFVALCGAPAPETHAIAKAAASEPVLAASGGCLLIMTDCGNEWFSGEAASAVPVLYGSSTAAAPGAAGGSGDSHAPTTATLETAIPSDVFATLRNGTRAAKRSQKVRCSARQDAPPAYPVFAAAAGAAGCEDVFWQQVFAKMSKSVFKRGFRFTPVVTDVTASAPSALAGVLTLTARNATVNVPSDPAAAFADVKAFMMKRAGISSELDQERMRNDLHEQYAVAARVRAAATTTESTTSNVMTLVSHFVSRTMGRAAPGAPKQVVDAHTRSLTHVLHLYSFSGVVRPDRFVMRNGAIDHVSGLHRAVEPAADRLFQSLTSGCYYFDLRAIPADPSAPASRKRAPAREPVSGDTSVSALGTVAGSYASTRRTASSTLGSMFPCGISAAFIASTVAPARNFNHGLPPPEDFIRDTDDDTLVEKVSAAFYDEHRPSSVSAAHGMCFSAALDAADAQVAVDTARRAWGGGGPAVSTEFPVYDTTDAAARAAARADKCFHESITVPLAAAVDGYLAATGYPLDEKVSAARRAAVRAVIANASAPDARPDGITKLCDYFSFMQAPETAAAAFARVLETVEDIQKTASATTATKRLATVLKTVMQRLLKTKALELTATVDAFYTNKVSARSRHETPSSLAAGTVGKHGYALKRWKKLSDMIVAAANV